MKNLLLFLLWMPLMFIGAQCGSNNDDPQPQTPTNPQPSVTTCPAGMATYLITGQGHPSASQTFERRHEFIFNTQGQLMKEKRTYLQDKLWAVATVNISYTYDNDGFLTEKATKLEDYKTLKGTFVEGVHKYQYQNGRLITETRNLNQYSFKGLDYGPYTLVTTYEYDAQGRLTVIKNGSNIDLTFSYDNAGVSGYTDPSVRGPSWKYTFQNGRVIREDRKSNTASSEFDRYTLYSYDAKGQLIKEEEYIKGVLWGIDEYTYDDKKRITESPEQASNVYSSLPFFVPQIFKFKGHPEKPSFFGVAVNNLVSAKAFATVGSKRLVSENIYAYQYNSDGYPMSLQFQFKGYDQNGTVVNPVSTSGRWEYCK